MTTRATPVPHALIAGLEARMVGPGGCYNLGNALCLATAIALPAMAMAGRGFSGAEALRAAAWQTLAGNPAAVALTVATGIFFWGAELYQRAWAQGAPPDAGLNRRGDLVSGVAALVFGAGMMGFGQPLLAAAAGLLQATGKFGSAAGRTTVPGWPADWPDVFRAAVLASRIPAVLAALVGLFGALASPDPMPAALGPAALLVCLALWARADLLLFAPPSASDPNESAR